MKLPLLITLLTLPLNVLIAEEEPWMKPPDGYVWPEAISPQPETKELPFSELPKIIQAFYIENSSLEQPPDTVHVARADLNGDGVAEWFVNNIEWGGNGGSFYHLIDTSEGGAKSLGDLFGGFRLHAAAPREKWLRIECNPRGGGGLSARNLLQYIDGEFQTVRWENHDKYKEKVTVEKIEKKKP